MPAPIQNRDYDTADGILSGCNVIELRFRIANAIAFERERCAQVAERLSEKPGWSPGYAGAASVIAKAIRVQS